MQLSLKNQSEETSNLGTTSNSSLSNPADDAGLSTTDMSAPPLTDTFVLQEPLKQLIKDYAPDCIVADAFHRWVPCCEYSLRWHSAHTEVSFDSEPFRIPGLPAKIELTRSRLPPAFLRMGNGVPAKMMIAKQNSFGQVINSFYGLEPAYVDHCRNAMRKKIWLVGPVSLCNNNLEDKVLKIGIAVGSEEWASWQLERKMVVGREKVEASVLRLMSDGDDEEEGERISEDA
ncbi:abscisate beta-glucosyltransferase-like [Coffea arabica]|uniref:Abscisate beta-glucosyltransferase-like n=1 Tax=Coffea arabica TaxID=13443 RepID=A0A6P6VJX6_COFAR|nr:abscisate beta-glucosyltransferase-like [Coffea arabica]